MLPDAAPQSIRFHGHGSRIADGVGYRFADTWLIYGTRLEAGFAVLGVDRGTGAPPSGLRTTLEDYAARSRLLLIDWCRCVVGQLGEESFAEALNGSQA